MELFKAESASYLLCMISSELIHAECSKLWVMHDQLRKLFCLEPVLRSYSPVSPTWKHLL